MRLMYAYDQWNNYWCGHLLVALPALWMINPTSYYKLQGFIQDFKLGGEVAMTCASLKHKSLGGSGSGGMPPPENV